jgi:hypothetical protein
MQAYSVGIRNKKGRRKDIKIMKGEELDRTEKERK